MCVFRRLCQNAGLTAASKVEFWNDQVAAWDFWLG